MKADYPFKKFFKQDTLLRLRSKILQKVKFSPKNKEINSSSGLVAKLKYLPGVLSPKEQRLMGIFSLIFAISLVWLLAALWLAITVAVPKSGGSYTEGIIGRPRSLNPIYAHANPADRDLVRLLYSGLVRFDGLRISPDLAVNWTISDDQKEYTFHLRTDLSWPDGEPFTAQDVIFTIEIIKDREFQSPLRGSFAQVQVAQIDDYTVTFTLPEPLTPFLEDLTVGILPKHIWQFVRPENVLLTDFNIRPLGLGPYRFKRLVKDQFGAIRSYSLERNESYHLGVPFIKKINLRFYPDEEAAVEALRRREIEGVNFLSLNQLSSLDPANLTIHELQLPQYTAVFFNLSSPSAISDKKVRQALAHAINREAIVREAIGNEGRVIHGPILPDFPGYHTDIEKLELDLAAARALLDEAGWTLTEGIRLNEDEEPLTLTLTTADRPELKRAAELIQQAWQGLGISVELSVVDIENIQQNIISPRDFDILLFGEIVGLDPDPYPFWHSSQISTEGFNLSNFKNSEADQVLEEARQTPDQKKKAEKYIHFQNILVAQIPAIFLYNPNYLYPTADKLKGLTQKRIITPTDRLARVHEWFIKTKRIFK